MTSLRRKSKKREAFDEELEAIRPKVLDRADYRCEAQIPEVCIGAWDLGLVVHHRKRRSQGGNNDPINLLVLCNQCHLHVHDQPTKSFMNGWLVKSGHDPELIAIRSYRND